jgi:hypothetical protein
MTLMNIWDNNESNIKSLTAADDFVLYVVYRNGGVAQSVRAEES